MVMFTLQCLLNIVALLGKTEVDDRPITLTHLLYALYICIRRPILAAWEASNHGWWDDAVKGSSALRTAISSRFRSEIAAATGHIDFHISRH